jgi:uroporphyrinogen decarboxylase
MSKQLLLDAIQGKKTPRVPWLPFVGCHGAALIGKTADEYLRSGELITRGVRRAIELYRPDGIPAIFDLQIEAEALGCALQWARENPPAVVSHVLETKTLRDLRTPDETSGRIPEALKAMRTLKAEGHDVALYGLITGPFTLALHLRGTEIFMDMYDRPEAVQELLGFCTRTAKAMAGMYIDAGCDVVASVDPMTSQISPAAFAEFVSPWASELFADVRRQGACSSFFVCVHAQNNVEVMSQCRPDNISVDENIPLAFVKEVCRINGVSFGGNLKLTTVLLMGTTDDVRRHVIETMDLGGDAGYILAPGCDLPYNVPAAHLQTVAEIVHDPYQQEIARRLLETAPEMETGIDLSEYGQASKVVVDIITLDSEACAPCQYMVEAVKAIVPHFKDLVIWREHKIKEKEAVEFMMGLMVKNVPTICIDGEIKFVSRIPAQEELINAIQERINERFAMRLKQGRGRLIVLGDDRDISEHAWQNVQQAVKELGSTVELVHVTDESVLADYGVAATPAVISVRERVKATGRVPSVDVIKEWIKELRQ